MFLWGNETMIAVRLATMDDAEIIARQTSSIQQLHNEALPQMFKPPSAELLPPRRLAALIQDSSFIVAVAEMDSKIVGHIYGAIVNRTENEFHPPHTYIYINQISVDEDVRRRGVGMALINFMRDRARALGLTVMQVDHFAFNARAGAFFEACGFSPMKIVMLQVVEDGRSR